MPSGGTAYGQTDQSMQKFVNGIFLTFSTISLVSHWRASVFCTNCGVNNSNEAHYCYNCGTSLSQTAPLSSELSHSTEATKATDPAQQSVQAHIREPNFLVKHWRGDYSLAFSYWIIGTVLTLIVFAMISAVGSSSRMHELGAKGAGAVILVFYCFAILLTIWQVAGIWRSADKHRLRGGNPFWAGVAKVMVVLGLIRAAGDFTTQGIPLLSEGAKLAAGIDNTPPHQIRILRDGTELELAGGMPFGTTEAVKKFLDAAPAVQVIHLNSQGGRMNEAYQLYKTIKDRNLSTYTSADCVSACSLAFLAGRERYLGESGRLGFHSTSIGELGGDVVNELNDDVRQTLQAHGVPNDFINRALSTSPNDMWYPSQQELVEAKVIDSVVDSRYFGLSGVTQWRDAHKIESQLLAIPLYSALAQYDQQNYARLRDILVSGIQKGRPLIETQTEIRAIVVGQLIGAYLKKAPDEDLIRYWHSQLAEMKHLAKLSPQHCADFAFPQFANSAQDLQRLLPKSLLTEDMEALAAVIKGVATNPQGYGLSPKIQKDFDAAVLRVTRAYPWALDVVRSPAHYKDDPDSLCTATIALFSEVLAIPSSNRSGAVLRYMLGE